MDRSWGVEYQVRIDVGHKTATISAVLHAKLKVTDIAKTVDTEYPQPAKDNPVAEEFCLAQKTMNLPANVL